MAWYDKLTQVQLDAMNSKKGGSTSGGTIITALGDSHTANAGPEKQKLPTGYYNWVVLYSNGALRAQQQAATGGMRTDEIRATHLPTILARNPLPHFCIVMGGTNDAGQSRPLSFTIENLTAIYDELEAAGIIPIVCAIPPRPTTVAAMQKATAKINKWLRDIAQKRKYPFVDVYKALADPATGAYIPSLTNDTIHMSTAGSKVAGKLIWDTIKPLVTPWKPYLATANNDPLNLFTNGLFLTDSDSNGMPDGIQRLNASVIRETPSLVPGTGDVAGNWYTVTKDEQTGTTSQRTTGITVIPGNKVGVAFRIKIEGIETASGGTLTMSTIKLNTGGTIMTNAFYIWNGDIDSGVHYSEFIVPEDVTSIQIDFVLGGPQVALSLAQLTVIDLTAAGMD